MSRELSLRLDHLESIVIAHLTGFLAQYEVYRFKNELETLVDHEYRTIIVNLADVEFVDSAGIGCILQVRKTCQSHSVNMVLVMPERPHVRQTLTSASLDKIITTFETVEQAKSKAAAHMGLALDETNQTITGSHRTLSEPEVVDAPAAPANGTMSMVPSTAELFHLLEDLRTRSERIESRLQHIESILQTGAVTGSDC